MEACDQWKTCFRVGLAMLLSRFETSDWFESKPEGSRLGGGPGFFFRLFRSLIIASPVSYFPQRRLQHLSRALRLIAWPRGSAASGLRRRPHLRRGRRHTDWQAKQRAAHRRLDCRTRPTRLRPRLSTSCSRPTACTGSTSSHRPGAHHGSPSRTSTHGRSSIRRATGKTRTS